MPSSKIPTPSTLTEIDAEALDAVVGGLRTATSSSSTDTRVLDAINGLGGAGSAAAPACPAGCCPTMNPANVIRR